MGLPEGQIQVTGRVALLALAAQDMRQAASAAKLLIDLPELDDRGAAARALETAIAVCYARPFLSRNRMGVPPRRLRPTDALGRKIHAELIKRRNQTYAHIDPTGGRVISGSFLTDDGGVVQRMDMQEQWIPIDRARLPDIIELCENQAARFLVDAFRSSQRDA
jgi:hypothetical protein